MTTDAGHHPDAAVLSEIRALAANISDQRAKSIVHSVLDAVALNPQPLPPEPPPEALGSIIKLIGDAVALNPQPLPPGPGDHVEIHPEPKVHEQGGPAGPG
ncbi:MAG: hypothetical protein QOG15_3814 [Solirubrobacteraceae bacterium]|jgi:hypothetical protein|nr:hypothetical protein [Solirubrobacteraceae bacterium]